MGSPGVGGGKRRSSTYIAQFGICPPSGPDRRAFRFGADKKKQYDEAAEEFRKVLKQNPIHGPAGLSLAMELSQHLGNADEAR